MKCQSCSEEVLAKYTYAISVNVCPYCGQGIISEFVKNILNELKSVLDKAKDSMGEIEDWLFTNYKLRRVSEDEVVVKKDDLPAQLDPTNRPEGKSGKGVSVHRSDEDDDEEMEVNDAKPLTPFAKRGGVNPKMTSKKALDFIKGKINQDSDPSILAAAFLKDDNEAGGSPMDDVPLSGNELEDMQDALGIGIQVDKDAGKDYDRHMSRLKNLQRK